MTTQMIVFIFWLAASIFVVAAFYVAYRRSIINPVSVTYNVINNRRFKFFYMLLLALLIIFFIALKGVPYSTLVKADDIIGVKAKMFSFELTKDTVECYKLIEFRIIAEDVTHGFGIYNDHGALIGQTQAMPGYINRLRVQFDAPGQYNILCLEYCGPLHHQMRDTIFVK